MVAPAPDATVAQLEDPGVGVPDAVAAFVHVVVEALDEEHVAGLGVADDLPAHLLLVLSQPLQELLERRLADHGPASHVEVVDEVVGHEIEDRGQVLALPGRDQVVERLAMVGHAELLGARGLRIIPDPPPRGAHAGGSQQSPSGTQRAWASHDMRRSAMQRLAPSEKLRPSWEQSAASSMPSSRAMWCRTTSAGTSACRVRQPVPVGEGEQGEGGETHVSSSGSGRVSPCSYERGRGRLHRSRCFPPHAMLARWRAEERPVQAAAGVRSGGSRPLWALLPPAAAGAGLRESLAGLEALGIAGVCVPQTYAPPFVPLAAMAMASERLSLATGIAIALTRSPFETACAAIELDRISGGRFHLGLGVAPRHWVDYYGADYDKPVSRVREVVEIVRHVEAGALAGEMKSYAGRFWQLAFRDFEPFAAPLRPRIPIWLAALRERVCELAGEVADGLIGHPMWSVEYALGTAQEALARGAVRAGRDPAALDFQAYVTASIDRDEQRAVELAKPFVAFYGSFAQYHSYYEEHGFGAAAQRLVDEVPRRSLREAGALVPDDMARTFVACGTPEQVRARIEPVVEARHLAGGAAAGLGSHGRRGGGEAGCDRRVDLAGGRRGLSGPGVGAPRRLVVPPGPVREGPHVDLVGPGRAVLVGQVEVGLGELARHQQPVVLEALRLAQLLEALGPEHAPEGVRGVDRTVDQDVRDVDPLRRELGVEGLAEHAPAPHGGRVGVLAGVAAHGRGGRGHEQRALAAGLPCAGTPPWRRGRARRWRAASRARRPCRGCSRATGPRSALRG